MSTFTLCFVLLYRKLSLKSLFFIFPFERKVKKKPAMNATGFLRRQEIYFFFPLAWLKITLITCVLFPHIQRKICPIHSLLLHYATITHIPQSKKGYNISKIAAEVSSSNLKKSQELQQDEICVTENTFFQQRISNGNDSCKH